MVTRRIVLSAGTWLALAASAGLMGCSRLKVEYASFGLRNFPPTNRSSIQVLFEKPATPHVEIGSLSVRGYPDTPVDQLLNSLINTAAERGANAIIVQNSDRISPRERRVGDTMQLARPNSMTAMAIRYSGGQAQPRGAPAGQSGPLSPVN